MSAVAIIEDDDSDLATLVRPEATVNTAIQLMGVMIDKRIATARQWPRSIAKFKKDATTLIREDKEVAEKAEYAKPVGGGTVRGPSIRLVEMAALCWGNLDDGMVEAVVEDKSVRVTWYAYDLEKNLRSEGYSSTSIIGKTGNRFPQHLIETTVLATASKARRNAIEKVIPKAFIKDLLAVAKEVARGALGTIDQARTTLLAFFKDKHGVDNQRVFALLGVKGGDDITETHIDDLRAIATSLKENEARVDEFFPSTVESKTGALAQKIEERRNGGKKPEEAPPNDQLARLIADFDARGGSWPEFYAGFSDIDPENRDALMVCKGTKRRDIITALTKLMPAS